jgi:cytoskeletal protein RodZ
MGTQAKSLGLARRRQKKGVSLETIAERTKISLQFLRAIEAEEFQKLPGGIFSTSYLRQYASIVELDPDELLAHYTECVALEPKPMAREGSRSSRGFMNRWLGTGTNPQAQH